MVDAQRLSAELAALGVEPLAAGDGSVARAARATRALAALGPAWAPLNQAIVAAWCGHRDGESVVGYRFSGGFWLIGGPPNPEPQLSEAWSHLEWALPEPLLALIRLHDGLGPLTGAEGGWWRDAVLPIADWESLIARVRFGEDNILYRPEDLLRWHADGERGGWCALREGGAETLAAKWDAHTHGLGEAASVDDAIRALVADWIEVGGWSARPPSRTGRP